MQQSFENLKYCKGINWQLAVEERFITIYGYAKCLELVV